MVRVGGEIKRTEIRNSVTTPNHTYTGGFSSTIFKLWVTLSQLSTPDYPLQIKYSYTPIFKVEDEREWERNGKVVLYHLVLPGVI